MEIVHTHLESKEKIIKNYHNLLGPSWLPPLKELLQSEYMDHMIYYTEQMFKKARAAEVFPINPKDIWSPFRFSVFEQIKVIIFNDEPAANPFSNGIGIGEYRSGNFKGYHNKMIELTDCLTNNYDLNITNFDTKLQHWAEQGVLYLNTSLISEKGKPNKNQLIYRNFIREVLIALNDHHYGLTIVFTSTLQSLHFKKYIDNQFHHIIEKNGLCKDSEVFNEINEFVKQEKGAGNKIIW